MQLATFEFQMKTAAFIAARLAAFKQGPLCPPDSFQGLQLQRLRVKDAVMRHNVMQDFDVFYREPRTSSAEDGLKGTDYPAKGFQAQMAIETILDVVQTTSIASDPNRLVPVEFTFTPVVVLNLDCIPGPIGGLYLTSKLDHVEWPEGAIPAAILPFVDADTVKRKLAELLAGAFPLRSVPLDLKGALPYGETFVNAGLAIDATGTRLAVRGEVAGGTSYNYLRWTTFRSGGITDWLGGHDWSVVVKASDLGSTLADSLYNFLRAAIKTDELRLISVDYNYAAEPGRAVFTLTPYIREETVNLTKNLPVRISFSLDAVSGQLVVELDAYGLRDLIDDSLSLISVFCQVMLPLLGAFVFTMISDKINDAIEDAKPAGGLGGLLPGVVFEEVPGKLLVYRGSLALSVPSFVNGSIRELITRPEGFSLAGALTTRNFTDADMTIKVGHFVWKAPKISCNVGRSVLEDVKEHPKRLASLYASVELSKTGSAPINFCSMTIFDQPAVPVLNSDDTFGPAKIPGIVVEAVPDGTALPTEIVVRAAPGLAELNPPPSINGEIRTTAGVFRLTIPPPQTLTAADIKFMVGTLENQLRACEVALPPWFGGNHKFDLDWIVDPLVDPPRETPEFVRIEVLGIPHDSVFVLLDRRGRTLASATAGASGAARIDTLLRPSVERPRAELRLPSAARPGVSTAHRVPTGSGVNYTRRRLLPGARLRLGQQVKALSAASPRTAGRFFAVVEDACLSIDASTAAKTAIVRRWDAPGALGVVGTRSGLIAYGDAGLLLLTRSGAVSCFDNRQREPVQLVTEDRGLYGIVYSNRIEVCNSYLATLSTIPMPHHSNAAIMIGTRLLVSSCGGVRIFNLHDPGQPCLERQFLNYDIRKFHVSPLTGQLMGHLRNDTWAEISLASGLDVAVTMADAPWGLRAASSGDTLLEMDASGFLIDCYSVGLTEPVTPSALSTSKGSDIRG